MTAIPFNPRDPFPLVLGTSTGEPAYADEQKHSEQVDTWLGLRITETEAKISPIPHRQNWAGLPPHALLTPYTEIRRLLHQLELPRGSRIVDLGSGYSRMAWVVGVHSPEHFFFGFELETPRVHESLRVLASWSFTNVRIQAQDIAHPDFTPPLADVYFIYDFGTKDEIRKILNQLREHAQAHPILVVGRGRATRDLIEQEEPWLSQIIAPEHHSRYSLYRSG